MDETLCFQPIPQNRQTTEMVEEKEHVKYYYDVTSLVPSRLRDEKWRIGNTISETTAVTFLEKFCTHGRDGSIVFPTQI